MSPSLVTCIVPVFNGERFLAEALDSILKQSYRPIEIIVVDDGSTDGTAGIVASYGKQVRYVHQANAGPGAARNLGLSLAQGTFIAFLDADDVWHPDKLTLQMASFEARPELELCNTHIKNFWVPELKHEEERLRDHRFSQELPGYVCQTVLARRSLFDKVGTFNVSLRIGEDCDWFSRCRHHDTVSEMLPEVFTYRRMHQNNLSHSIYSSTGKENQMQVVMDALQRKRQREKGA